jgi:signal transduction histidine kinase/CheY-like chemotaxis protein
MKLLPPSPVARNAWPVIALVVASLLIPLLLFAIVAWEDRKSILRDAELDVTHTTDILYEHALKVFETHELIATAIDGRIRSMSWDEISASRSVHEYLKWIEAQYPQVQGLWLVDPTGALRNSSRTFPVTPVNLSDRDYFVALRDRDVGTFVSHVVTGRAFGEANFNVVRRRSGSNSQFDGVIVVSVFPTYFAEFWRKTAPPLDMMAGLLRSDRKILARQPTSPSDELAPSSAIGAAIQQADEGSFRTISAVDGIERLMAFRRVGPYNVFVVHGIGVNAALGRWYDDLKVDGSFFGLAALALLFTSLLALTRMRREHMATDHWHAAARRLVEESERRQAAENQLHHAEKMEALGQLTGGIAHDFNNLLTSILGNLDLLRGRIGNPKDETKLLDAIAAAERGEKAVQSLLVFARREPLQAQVIDLHHVLRELESLLRQAIGSRSDFVFAVSDGTWPVEADLNQLELAILNLAVNARDAMSAGGTLRIATANMRLEGKPNGLVGEFVAVSVSDTGIGMPPELISRAFEPFFTTKEPGKGTGLGLSQVYGFATHIGGTVTVDSVVKRGTTVTMYLRKASSHQVHDKDRPEPRTAPTDPGIERPSVILVVEDEEGIRHMVMESLREQGHIVIEAASGDEALPIVRERPEIDLILTDVRMPGRTDGVALAREARRLHPGIKILFATGYAGDVVRDDGPVEGDRIIKKPFRPSQIAQAIQNALAA